MSNSSNHQPSEKFDSAANERMLLAMIERLNKEQELNRVTVFMFVLSAFLTAVGSGLLWLAIATGAWIGILISLAWIAFTGPIAVFAWRIRYEA